MTTLEIQQQDSLLNEIRGLGAKAPDFPTAFPAHTPQVGKHRPLKAGGVGPTGEALFWIDLAGTPFVDARVFGPLQAVSIIRLAPGVSATVGRLLAKLDPATVIGQLIAADVIGTYAHTESTLCVVEIPGGVHITGTHTYFTNTENTDPLDFKVLIDPAGVITVTNG
jgi:hypothetical protein